MLIDELINYAHYESVSYVSPASELDWTSSVQRINDIDIHIVEAGNGGDPIVFLHGFPDYWGVWARLMRLLEGEFSVFAPDLRGYNRTTRPEDLEAYRPEKLIADGAGLLRALNLSDVTLVGHDWGATLAFWMALEKPERIKRLVILNGAHPYVLQDCICDDPAQRAASQYIRRIMSGEAGETLNAANAPKIAQLWLGEAKELGTVNEQEYEVYLSLWSEPDAWPAMMNWYRASPFIVPDAGAPSPAPRWSAGRDYTVPCPVTVIWGDQDKVFQPSVLEALKPHVSDLEIHHLPTAGHVPQRDNPEFCAKIIAEAARRRVD